MEEKMQGNEDRGRVAEHHHQDDERGYHERGEV